MQLWIFIGPVVGGGLGWLLGRYNSRKPKESCNAVAAPA
jgi:hypothetical protein